MKKFYNPSVARIAMNQSHKLPVVDTNGFAFYRNKMRTVGFTLIELLIVVGIIGILGGVVLAVINPAKQQRRANEAVLRANTDKLCLALNACVAAKTTSAACSDLVFLGVEDPSGTPLTSTYTLTLNRDDTIDLVGTLPTGPGNAEDCVYLCTYDFNTGISTGPIDSKSTCL